MKTRLELIGAMSVIITSMLACSLSAAPSSSQPDYVATITAQAAQLGGTPAQAGTPTASAVTANVTATTNCRSGPGTAYSIVTALNAGQQVTVAGQDTADNYWIVTNPDGSGTCWLWGQYATVTGDTAALAQVQPPAAPTPKPTKAASAPAAPKNVSAQVTCKLVKTNLGIYNFNFSYSVQWGDVANAQGYRVLGETKVLATLPAGATSYSGEVVDSGLSIPVTKQLTGVTIAGFFAVESFNAAGSAKSGYVTATCP